MSYDVIEGLDYAGKSELSKAVAGILNYRLIAEPFTETEHAALVKKLNNSNTLPKYYEIMMLAASRLEGFELVVKEHREKGLISDRSIVSSMVYQSTPEFSPLWILETNKELLSKKGHDIYPDNLFFIDISHETFLERIEKSGRRPDGKDLWLKNKSNWDNYRDKYMLSIDLFRLNNSITQLHFINETTTAQDVADIISSSNVGDLSDFTL